MNIQDLIAGGIGSGCNPRAGKCGRRRTRFGSEQKEIKVKLLHEAIEKGKLSDLYYRYSRQADNASFHDNDVLTKQLEQTANKFDKLDSLITDWSNNSYKSIRTNLVNCFKGSCKDDSIRTLTNILATAPLKSGTLFRGLFFSSRSRLEEVMQKFKVGKSIDIPPSSFSSSERVAKDFALNWYGNDEYGVKPKGIVLQTVGRSQSLKLHNSYSNEEKESIVTGRYKVLSTEVKKGLIYVKVRQVGRFRPR